MSCGTYAGWNRHMTRREKACPDCQTAHTRYTARWRFTTGRQLDPRRCACGSVFPDHTCHLAR